MSIITRFLSTIVEPQFKLARDLMSMAVVDGKITDEEKTAIADICQLEGVDEGTLLDSLQEKPDDISEEMPPTRKAKEEYLRNLIVLIGADAVSAPQEIYLFQIIASRMKLNQMDVVSLFLMTATHQYFKGDIGSKVLASFLKNFIDPKSKGEQACRNNLHCIYETIAQNTETLSDKEASKRLLSDNLKRATEVFAQNQILFNEFRHIGIDFAHFLKEVEMSVYSDYAEH